MEMAGSTDVTAHQGRGLVARLAPTLHEPKGRARRARGTVIRHVLGAPFHLGLGRLRRGLETEKLCVETENYYNTEEKVQ